MYIRFFKRALDIFFVLIIIGLFSWLLLLIALIYVIQFQFPLLFKQERIGKNNSSFTIYKFRTLKVSENLDLNKRRFWWGDVLRFFSLDEFPQLFNVLRGEMSLIGPRPLPAEYLPLMNEQQRERHQVRPGITGWTQVNGRHEIDWKKKFELDNYYVAHVSFVFDLKILLKTIALIFSFRKDKSLSEERFKGNS